MLIALFTLLILGGGGGDTPMPGDFDKYVKKVVVEKDRQKEVLVATKEMKSITKAYAKQAKALSKEGYELNRSYNTTDAQLEELANRFRDQRHELEVDLVEQRLKITEIMTKEEWDAVMLKIEEGKK